MKLDDTICYCFHVPKRKIINFIRIHRTLRVTAAMEALTDSGWGIEKLIAELDRRSAVAA